jgi:acetyl esterase/lipase
MPKGRYALTYDPGIAVPFKARPLRRPVAVWDAIRCPTLVLRGAQSDLLSVATAQAMTARGPKARLVEFPGVGHARCSFRPISSLRWSPSCAKVLIDAANCRAINAGMVRASRGGFPGRSLRIDPICAIL